MFGDPHHFSAATFHFYIHTEVSYLTGREEAQWFSGKLDQELGVWASSPSSCNGQLCH